MIKSQLFSLFDTTIAMIYLNAILPITFCCFIKQAMMMMILESTNKLK